MTLGTQALPSTHHRDYIDNSTLDFSREDTEEMAEEVKQPKEPKKPAELLLVAVLGLLTIAALLLILTDLQGWI